MTAHVQCARRERVAEHARCIERSNRAKLIEARAINADDNG
jgi:hypothetical protein